MIILLTRFFGMEKRESLSVNFLGNFLQFVGSFVHKRERKMKRARPNESRASWDDEDERGIPFRWLPGPASVRLPDALLLDAVQVVFPSSATFRLRRWRRGV